MTLLSPILFGFTFLFLMASKSFKKANTHREGGGFFYFIIATVIKSLVYVLIATYSIIFLIASIWPQENMSYSISIVFEIIETFPFILIPTPIYFFIAIIYRIKRRGWIVKDHDNIFSVSSKKYGVDLAIDSNPNVKILTINDEEFSIDQHEIWAFYRSTRKTEYLGGRILARTDRYVYGGKTEYVDVYENTPTISHTIDTGPGELSLKSLDVGELEINFMGMPDHLSRKCKKRISELLTHH